MLRWPLTVVRLFGDDERVLDVADRVLTGWRSYSDPDRGVLAATGQTPHNTITPIARRVEGRLRLDLVLRNNRTSPDHPDGIFHPHAEIHPIKRENIGLIEVMGLAVLPDRLHTELRMVADALMSGGALPDVASAHEPMLDGLRDADPPADLAEAYSRARSAASAYFVQGLEHCSVFGRDVVGGCQDFLAGLD